MTVLNVSHTNEEAPNEHAPFAARDDLPAAIKQAQPESASTGSGFAFCAIQECYCLLGSSAELT